MQTFKYIVAMYLVLTTTLDNDGILCISCGIGRTHQVMISEGCQRNTFCNLETSEISLGDSSFGGYNFWCGTRHRI